MILTYNWQLILSQLIEGGKKKKGPQTQRGRPKLSYNRIHRFRGRSWMVVGSHALL